MASQGATLKTETCEVQALLAEIKPQGITSINSLIEQAGQKYYSHSQSERTAMVRKARLDFESIDDRKTWMPPEFVQRYRAYLRTRKPPKRKAA